MNQNISSPTSSSKASGSGPALPSTPKSTRLQGQRTPVGRQRKALSSSPQTYIPFASSSVCSSPSARNVPLPPIEWLNKLQVPNDESPSRPSSCLSTSSSSSASSPSSSLPSSPVGQLYQEKPPTNKLVDAGIRVCPMQLIAAVVSA
ncbi:unnamed protein product [Caenorhabditis brenneri]